MAGRVLFTAEKKPQGRVLFDVKEAVQEPKTVEDAKVTRISQDASPQITQGKQFEFEPIGGGVAQEQQRVREVRRQKDIESLKTAPEKKTKPISIAGIPEAATTIATGAIAEPVSGLAGV